MSKPSTSSELLAIALLQTNKYTNKLKGLGANMLLVIATLNSVIAI